MKRCDWFVGCPLDSDHFEMALQGRGKALDNPRERCCVVFCGNLIEFRETRIGRVCLMHVTDSSPSVGHHIVLLEAFHNAAQKRTRSTLFFKKHFSSFEVHSTGFAFGIPQCKTVKPTNLKLLRTKQPVHPTLRQEKPLHETHTFPSHRSWMCVCFDALGDPGDQDLFWFPQGRTRGRFPFYFCLHNSV